MRTWRAGQAVRPSPLSSCDQKAKPFLEGAIAVIGNAPVALMELSRMIIEEGLRPSLVVALPVGFVHVVESKEELMSLWGSLHHDGGPPRGKSAGGRRNPRPLRFGGRKGRRGKAVTDWSLNSSGVMHDREADRPQPQYEWKREAGGDPDRPWQPRRGAGGVEERGSPGGSGRPQGAGSSMHAGWPTGPLSGRSTVRPAGGKDGHRHPLFSTFRCSSAPGHPGNTPGGGGQETPRSPPGTRQGASR